MMPNQIAARGREPRHRHAILVALSVVAAVVGSLLLALAPTSAATVSMEARALVGGRYESGGWLAISVSLRNDGAPITGAVVADGADGTVRRPVDLPAGARKQVELYVRPTGAAREIRIRFEEDGGGALANTVAEVRTFDIDSAAIAIVGDGTGIVRAQIVARGQGTGEPLILSAGDLPQRPEPLDGLSAIVWAGDSTGLTAGQTRSLERWVASGGQMIVLGGPDWQARTAAFDDLLPMTDLSAVDDVPSAALAELAGTSDELPAATVASGTLRDRAIGLATTTDTAALPLIATMSFGGGRMSYVAVDLGAEAFRSAGAVPLLWARMLPQQGSAGGGFIDKGMDADSIMTQALSAIPSLEVPPAELLLAVLATYILLIGPISYIVLRRLDRRELAWVTAPLLVVLFTAGSFGIGSSLKGTQIVVNEIAVVRAAVDGSAASVQTYAGVFSPTRDSYDVSVAGDALLAPVRSFDGTTPRAGFVVEQGEPARLTGLQVTTFGLQAIRADTVVDYGAALGVTWRSGDGEIAGEVVNRSGAPLTDVAIVTTSGGRMIGDLDPGESREFALRFALPQGSPSDSVYGFGDFENDSVRQREIQSRRQVIDTLVGYGQFGPMTGRASDGPYIVGWRTDAPPTEVELEGVTAQRYHQTVEVISGRPALGPGSVRLEPGQLSVALVATDGDASNGEGGSVFLGNGSATFSVSLPLEAAALQVSEVTIVGASDPSALLTDAGNMMGMFQPGFVLEVQDATSGEWIELGDLSQSTRYTVDDPAAVVDSGGRIAIRVTGAEIDQSFGQIQIWLSAAVEGEI